jgi:hypothetical protein
LAADGSYSTAYLVSTTLDRSIPIPKPPAPKPSVTTDRQIRGDLRTTEEFHPNELTVSSQKSFSPRATTFILFTAFSTIAEVALLHMLELVLAAHLIEIVVVIIFNPFFDFLLVSQVPNMASSL